MDSGSDKKPPGRGIANGGPDGRPREQKGHGSDMLSREQEAAVDFLLRHEGREAGLVGWAGTGKTYTTARYVLEEQRRGRRVIVLAPTHRACDVLRGEMRTAGVDVEVTTVHAGCGLVPCLETRRARERGPARAADADVVIVDEASMLDGALLAKVRKLAAARLVYVGDPYQLAPVGSSGTPAFEGLEVARLTTTRRYQAGSILDELTAHLRRCVDERRLPMLREIEQALPSRSGGLAEAARLLREGWEANEAGVVVAYRNVTAFAACARVQGGRRYRWEVGDPVSFLSPWSYDDGSRRGARVHSGTEAVVAGVAEGKGPAMLLDLEYVDGGRQVVPTWTAETTSRWIEIKRSVSARHRCKREAWEAYLRDTPELAGMVAGSASEALEQLGRYATLRQTWATTAHKAQGGSYDRVIVAWDDLLRASSKPEMLARLLYVAVTRVRSIDGLYLVRGDQ